MSWQLVRRNAPSALTHLAVPAGAVGLALLVGAGLFAAMGVSPLPALWTLLHDPLLTSFGLTETLLKTGPLALCALSVALARRVGLWNIGAEGQLYVGAFAATAVALLEPDLFAPLRLPMLFAAGALGGALWAVVPALLRVHRGTSEILTTLMFNYVGIAWVEMWVFGPWKGPDRYPYTVQIGPSWQLDPVAGRLHLGLIFVVVLALGFGLVLKNTILGYEMKLIEASPEAARYAGIPVERRLVSAFTAAGALAGLAGALVVSGEQHRLQADLSPGYGYTAILAAFLAGSLPVPALLASFLLAALDVGGEGLPASFPALSSGTVEVFKGALLAAVLVGQVSVRYRLVRVGPVEER